MFDDANLKNILSCLLIAMLLPAQLPNTKYVMSIGDPSFENFFSKNQFLQSAHKELAND